MGTENDPGLGTTGSEQISPALRYLLLEKRITCPFEVGTDEISYRSLFPGHRRDIDQLSGKFKQLHLI
jgi:hypothetical protein